MLGGGTSSPRKKIDIKTLRQFFMGMLGWTPEIVMKQATVEDLADAYEGYMFINGACEQEKQMPSKKFMQEMLNKFPDN